MPAPTRPSGKPRTKSPRSPAPPVSTDPLADAVKAAGLGDPVRDALIRVLARQMAEDHFAKLEQAGDTEHDGIPLRRVFVDLDTSDNPFGGGNSGPFVRELLEKAPAPIGSARARDTQSAMDLAARRTSAGFVLIGGPGQGKSTVGQLACQVHRALWLAPYKDLLTDKERRALADLQEDGSLGRPHTASLPVRIVLPEAAAWLAAEQKRDAKAADDPQRLPWILRFWCAGLGEEDRRHLPPANLLALLKAVPFLLVLDGLDEVPAAGARERVLSAVRALGESLSGTGARGLFLATTRPQGYGGELDSLGVSLETRYLAPLDREKALTYASRLVEARVPGESDRARVIERLSEASREPATQRLLTTPLQVTILVALVLKGGQLPRERWSLFEQYYGAIYAREVNKPTDTAELLKELKGHISAIHAHAGLLLQVESENAERTAALLSRDRLEAIADAVLGEEGFPEPSRAELVARIVRAAEQRLVFLVEPQPGKFGFEIRSLQEHMAAKALSAKSDAATRARLLHVARAGSFRNVTLFLTGKLFAEGGDLRDTLAKEVCPALQGDPRDALATAAAAGAVLALEILEEGSPMSQPRRAADLMHVALAVLDLPPSSLQARLARLVQTGSQARETLSGLLRDGLSVRLSRQGVHDQLGAWTALLCLTDDGPAWAEPMARTLWPEDAAAAQVIIEGAIFESREQATLPTISHWLFDRIGDALERWSPKPAIRTLRWWHVVGSKTKREFSTAVQPMLELLGEPERSVIRLKERATSFYQFAHSLAGARKWQALLPRLPKAPAWASFRAMATFAAHPGPPTLAGALHAFATLGGLDEVRNLAVWAPWPLTTLLEVASSIEHIRELAELAERGVLGDLPLWQKAETHWREGVSFEALLLAAPALANAPWQVDTIVEAPLPLLRLTIGPIFEEPAHDRLLRALVESFEHSRPQNRPFLARLIATISAFDYDRSNLPRLDTSALARITPFLAFCPADGFRDILARGVEGAPILATWGERRPAIEEDGADAEVSGVAAIADWYTAHPAAHGLLYFLGATSDVDAARRIPPELLERNRFADSLVRADAWLVRLLQGSVTAADVPALLRDTDEAAAADPKVGQRLLSMLWHTPVADSVQETILAALVGWRSRVAIAAQALRQALSILQARTSGLDQPDTWIRLELPLPRPLSEPVLPAAAAEVLHPPVHLSRIVLKNIRSLERVDLDPTVPSEDRGQWTVLLGENGSGKSTILRAIVLALRNLSDPQVWPKGTFASRWLRIGIDPEKEEGSISVTLAGEPEYTTRVVANGRELFLQSPVRSLAGSTPFLLWGYGCRRGSALGGKERAVDVTEDDGPDIATLFDEGASLVHAQTWLQTQDGAASRDATGRKRAVFDAVIAALKKLLDVNEIGFDERSNIIVSGDRVGQRVPLEALSDGYVTTAGWVIDLLARWLARAEQAGIEVTDDFPRSITGLVLLDEVDLHLHPAWQLDVITRMRDIFPRLSFVVTTHNPLTLVGARPDEIWILSREDGRARAERRADVPALLTGAQLFQRFFGITGFFPNDLGQKLQRYGFLAGDPHRSEQDQREMEELREALKEKGIVPGWEEVPRAAPEAPKRRASRRKAS